MPRRRPERRKGTGLPPLPADRRIETGADGYDYEVRAIAAARTAKSYRCPGCDHEIRTGTAHVVVWRVYEGAAGQSAVEDRRHWHTPCWANRAKRGPTRKWS